MTRSDVYARVVKAGGEFLLIVTGVLTALAIETWNNGRLDAQRERVYLQALLADIESQVALFDRWQESYDTRIAVADALWRYATNDSPPELSAEDLYAAILSGGNYTPRRLFRDATYQELLSTGRLQLIRTDELRAQLIDYYALRAQLLSWMDESSRSAEERWSAASAGIMPAALQGARYQGTTIRASDFEPAVRALSREEVKQAILYMLSTLNDAKYFAAEQRESAARLVDALRAELGEAAPVLSATGS